MAATRRFAVAFQLSHARISKLFNVVKCYIRIRYKENYLITAIIYDQIVYKYHSVINDQLGI